MRSPRNPVRFRLSSRLFIEKFSKEMKNNEPGTIKMECYFADEAGAIIVHDLFKDVEPWALIWGERQLVTFPSCLKLRYPVPSSSVVMYQEN